ncbi:MAG: SURF1 family protein [Ilumatobacteraceae bacterium]
MYRFLVRPKWIAFTLLFAVALVAMLNLSAWQFHRLDERQAFNERVTERLAEPPVALAALADDPADEREWRTVTATGTYDGAATERVPTAGGYYLVTPFETDGRTVFVRRGTMRSSETQPSAPAGAVQLVAHFRSIPSVTESVPADAVYVELTSSTPAEVGLCARTPRARRRPAPLVRDPVVDLLGVSGDRLGARRAPLGQDRGGRSGRAARRIRGDGRPAPQAPSGSVAGRNPASLSQRRAAVSNRVGSPIRESHLEPGGARANTFRITAVTSLNGARVRYRSTARSAARRGVEEVRGVAVQCGTIPRP